MNKDIEPSGVWAIVVTHNRLELLKGCINSLRTQSQQPEHILVVNNGSTDGTQEWLQEQVDLEILHQVNLGGAGGFHFGIKHAYQSGGEFFWLMDDDVVCTHNALKELYAKVEVVKKNGFLCSKVISIDGGVMNVPEIDMSLGSTGYPSWGFNIELAMIKVKSATFVSFFLSRQVVSRVGLPLKDMFIWGDDTEYSKRISEIYDSFIVGKSVVVHKRSTIKPVSLSYETDCNRLNNYFFKYKNEIFIKIKYNEITLDYIYRMVRFFLRIVLLERNKLKKLSVLLRGVVSGIFFKPKNEYP